MPSEEPRPDLVFSSRAARWRRPALPEQLGGHRLPQVLRQPLRLGRLPGHQGMGLDVEREARRRALQPQLAGASRGQRVVRRIDLDDGELVRVVDEPILRGAGIGAGRRRLAQSSSGPSRTRSRCGPSRRQRPEAHATRPHAIRHGDRRRPVPGRGGSRRSSGHASPDTGQLLSGTSGTRAPGAGQSCPSACRTGPVDSTIITTAAIAKPMR